MTPEELKLELKTMTNGKKVITNFVNSSRCDETFNNVLIEALLIFHPTKNIQNIEYLVVRLSVEFHQKMLCYKNANEEEDNVSYSQCLKNLFGRYKFDRRQNELIEKALRYAIFNSSTKQFVLKNCVKNKVDGKYYGSCAICSLFGNMTVDHFNRPFNDIKNAFLKTISTPILVSETAELVYTFLNEDIKSSWIHFHDSRAEYRLLCQICNSKCGTNGIFCT